MIQVTLSTLRKARRLIDKGWTQNTAARDLSGDGLPADDPHAVCWCMTGAVRAAIPLSGTAKDAAMIDPLNELRLTIWGHPQRAAERALTRWNDSLTRKKAEVLAVFDVTIERLEKQANG